MFIPLDGLSESSELDIAEAIADLTAKLRASGYSMPALTARRISSMWFTSIPTPRRENADATAAGADNGTLCVRDDP